MGNRYSVLACDIDDPVDIQKIGTVVKENKSKGACSYFELETRLSARIVIECNPAFGAKVQVVDDDGVCGEVMSSSGVTWHRYLKIKRPVDDLRRGVMAHKILSVINACEEKIPEENIRGYDMIIFYIREGYVPVRDEHSADLKKELVSYLKRKINGDGEISELERNILPHVKLQLDEETATGYWEELKELSGYVESGN